LGIPLISGADEPRFFSHLYPCGDEQASHQGEHGGEAIDNQPLPPASTDNRYNQGRSNDIAQSVLSLSQQLTKNILGESKRKFEILSPISIAAALHLAFLGANGKTFKEIMDL
jgi:Serpin (serine protease inhibitor)